MSVDFTARLIYGYKVSRSEISEIDEDIFEEIYDEYMTSSDAYDDNSDFFFIIKDLGSTGTWTEIDIYTEGLPSEIERIMKFQELFQNRAKESPKYYLIERVL